MSAQNVEIVRRAYEAWNSDDPESAIDLLDPQVRWSLPQHFPDAETWQGRERVVEGLTAMAGAWESLRIDVHELIDEGDRVVARVRFQGRSAITGLALEGAGIDRQVWTLRDGLVVEVEMLGGSPE
jgi:ketosteroid isomerase-like protein